MNAVLTRVRVEEQQAAAVVLNDASQTGADRHEHLLHAEVRHDGVVDLEQQLQPIALALELPLRRLRALVVEDVVHGNGDLTATSMNVRSESW